MAKLNKKTFKFNGIEWDVLSKDSGELPINIDEEKLATWIKNGAKPTDSVKMLIEKK